MICQECGKEFVAPLRSRTCYCSEECKRRANNRLARLRYKPKGTTERKICVYCGSEFRSSGRHRNHCYKEQCIAIYNAEKGIYRKGSCKDEKTVFPQWIRDIKDSVVRGNAEFYFMTGQEEKARAISECHNEKEMMVVWKDLEYSRLPKLSTICNATQVSNYATS